MSIYTLAGIYVVGFMLTLLWLARYSRHSLEYETGGAVFIALVWFFFAPVFALYWTLGALAKFALRIVPAKES